MYVLNLPSMHNIILHISVIGWYIIHIPNVGITGIVKFDVEPLDLI